MLQSADGRLAPLSPAFVSRALSLCVLVVHLAQLRAGGGAGILNIMYLILNIIYYMK